MSNISLTQIIFRIYMLVSILCIFKINSQLNYDDEASKSWASICTSGTRQSPLDFTSDFTLYDIKEKVKVTKVAYLNQGDAKGSLKIVNLNKFIYSLAESDGGYVNLQKDGVTYKYNLVEVVFHVKSEHLINGIEGDLEIQLVHKKDVSALSPGQSDMDSANKYLIISNLFKTSTIESVKLVNIDPSFL